MGSGGSILFVLSPPTRPKYRLNKNIKKKKKKKKKKRLKVGKCETNINMADHLKKLAEDFVS